MIRCYLSIGRPFLVSLGTNTSTDITPSLSRYWPWFKVNHYLNTFLLITRIYFSEIQVEKFVGTSSLLLGNSWYTLNYWLCFFSYLCTLDNIPIGETNILPKDSLLWLTQYIYQVLFIRMKLGNMNILTVANLK